MQLKIETYIYKLCLDINLVFFYLFQVKNHFHVHGLIVIKRSLDRTSSVDIDEHIPAKRNMSVRFVKKRL